MLRQVVLMSNELLSVALRGVRAVHLPSHLFHDRFPIDEHICCAAHTINGLATDYVQFILVTVFFGSASPVRYRPVSCFVKDRPLWHKGVPCNSIFGLTIDLQMFLYPEWKRHFI